MTGQPVIEHDDCGRAIRHLTTANEPHTSEAELLADLGINEAAPTAPKQEASDE